MSDTLQSLEKEVSKRKRVVAEWAGRMHDLAEEGLPEGYGEIARIAEGTLRACLEWREAVEALSAAKQSVCGS